MDESRAATPRQFSLGEAFVVGAGTLKESYWLLVGVAVVYGLMSFAIRSGTGFLDAVFFGTNAGASQTGVTFGVFGFLGDVLFLTPLSAGTWLLGAQLARHNPVGLNDMFQGFRRYVPVVAVGLIVQVILGVAMGIGAAFAAATVGGGAGGGSIPALIAIGVVSLLLLAFIGTRFAVATVFCADPEAGSPGIMESVKASWSMTGNLRWISVFLGLAALMIIYLISLLLLILPALFFGGPFAIATAGAIYASLKRAHDLPYGEGHCRACGYSLEGITGDRCPECGQLVDAPASGVSPASA